MRLCWALCVVLCIASWSAVWFAPFCAAGADAAVAASEGEAPKDAVMGRWEILPLPESVLRGDAIEGVVYDFGVDAGGTLYMRAGSRVYHWNGTQFMPVVGLSEMYAQTVERFIGGPDRGLYIAEQGEDAFQGKLHRLKGGEAEYVTNFYLEASDRPPAILVTKSGRLINWGTRFVAAYADGRWSRVESPTAIEQPLVFDTGKRAHIYVPGWLCTVDERGALTTRELDDPFTETDRMRIRPLLHGVLWGTDSALIFRSPGEAVWAFDLATGEPVDVRHIAGALGGMTVCDAARMNDGSVWVYVLGGRVRGTGWGFVVLGADGRLVRRVDAAEINWQESRLVAYPHSLLEASDGTIWFAEALGGIVACRNGTFTHFGWRDGIRTWCTWLAEGPDGTLYAGVPRLTAEAIHVFRRTKDESRPPAWTGLWHEFRFASGTAVPDSAGGVWMCLSDRPGMLSRWDGKAWHDTAVPFATAKVRWLGVDDQGRIIARVSWGENEACLIGPDGATAYARVEGALQAAVERGARRFTFSGYFPSAAVLDDGKIWYASGVHEAPSYFDGKRWQTVKLEGGSLWEFRPDEKHGVLLVTTRGKAYAYADDQLTLVGSVEGPPDSAAYLPRSFPSRIGGCWKQPAKGQRLHRMLGSALFQCDLSDTPLPSTYVPEWIFDDAAGNVWIEGGWQGTPRDMFMKQVSGFELRPVSIPAEAAGAVTIEMGVVLEGKPQTGWRLFYRLGRAGGLDGGEWRGGEAAPKLTIEFPEDGRYEVEVIGVGPLGETTPESVTFTVESKAE